jgi:heme/copper-type cytochrome/quinol oxidase subunit 2
MIDMMMMMIIIIIIIIIIITMIIIPDLEDSNKGVGPQREAYTPWRQNTTTESRREGGGREKERKQ